MGFRGQEFAFDSPGSAVAGMIARVVPRFAVSRMTRSVEAVPLDAARGRILAEDIPCDRDSPAFDYSAMDGYAVRAADLARAIAEHASAPHLLLPIIGEARIGRAPPTMSDVAVLPGAIRIVTGAAIPFGSDAVIRREDVSESADASKIGIDARAACKVCAGDNIRRRGENSRRGDTVLHAGAVLSAAAMGTLAAVGGGRPLVYPRLRVAIITTGDELVSPDVAPGEFEIRNSNAPVIGAVLAAQSWIEVGSVTHAGDDNSQVDGALRDAITRVDAIVLTGGVSMGHRDPVRAALESIGAEMVFHGLPQRPGKPVLGAVFRRPDAAAVPVFGLPGNPVSAMVTCTRIVVPVLAACAGAQRLPPAPSVALPKSDGKTLDLWWHRLVRLNDRGEAELVDGRGSGDIVAGGRSDGFIEVPAGSGADAGDAAGTYQFYKWPI